MPRPERTIIAREIIVDAAGIGAALGITEEQVKRDFQTQTSLLYAFGRSWVENAFAIAAIAEPQRRGYRASPEHRELGKVFNIRGLNFGSFQPQNSIRKGAIREAFSDRNDVLEDTSNFDSYVVVDGKSFPRILLYPVPTAALLNFMDDEGVDKAGISRTRFNKFLRENFTIEYRSCTEHQPVQAAMEFDEPALPQF